MPMTHDDYAYAFVWDGEHGGNLDAMQKGEEFEHRDRVQSFSDIIHSQYSHYFTWGGRVIGHSLAQFFIWVGKFYFDIANTIILGLLVLMILRLAKLSWKSSTFAVFWIFFNLLFISGESIVTMLFLTGACNYLWMGLLQLTFLFPYVRTLQKNFRDSKILSCVMFPAGILAGWSNEAGGLAVLCLTGVLIFYAHKKNFLCRFMVAGFFGVVTGCAFDILAPGNFVQTQFIQAVNPNFIYTQKLFSEHITQGFLPTVAINLFALSPAIYFFSKRGLKNLRETEILILAFAGAGFVVPCAMMFSPKFDLRVSFIALTFILTASTFALVELKKFADFKYILRLMFCGLLFCFLYGATLIYSDLSMYRAVREQTAYIEQHRLEEVVELEPLPVSRIFEKYQSGKILSTWVCFFAGIQPDENYCLNLMVAQYYGARKIVGKFK